MKTFEVCFEPDRNLKIKKRQLISLCHLLKTTESGEGRTCATLLTRGIFSAVFSSACTGVQRHWKRRGRGIERQREWRRDLWGEHTHSVGGALRVRGRAGDAAAALGWGTTPRPPAVFQRGGRGGTVGDPFLHSQQKKTNTARAAITWHILFSNTLLQTHKRPCFFLLFFLRHRPPTPSSASFPCFLSQAIVWQTAPCNAVRKRGSRTTQPPPPSLNGWWEMCMIQWENGAVGYLNHWCHHSGWRTLCMCCGGHIGDGVEVVHLTHRHGDGCGRQADRDQGVGHHHKRQFQAWRWERSWLINHFWHWVVCKWKTSVRQKRKHNAEDERKI